MDFCEKTVRQEYKFRGKIMRARVDDIVLPNGRPGYREVCEHVGGVGVLPIDSEGNVVLVRQFRYPYGEMILEIPAGKLDHGAEDAEACGRRELREETGFTAGRMVPLGVLYPSPGFLDEVVHLYAALQLVPGESAPDEDEFVERVQMPFDELERLIKINEIRDAKTIAAAYRARMQALCSK